VAQAGAVIGRAFPFDLLHGLEGSMPSRRSASSSLASSFSRDQQTMEYIFKHAITRDVAYSTILVGRRLPPRVHWPG